MYVNVSIVKSPLSLAIYKDKTKVGNNAVDNADENKHSVRESVGHVSKGNEDTGVNLPHVQMVLIQSEPNRLGGQIHVVQVS
jgi:hypothetical protein